MMQMLKVRLYGADGNVNFSKVACQKYNTLHIVSLRQLISNTTD